jgi:hypothetical protein
MIKKEKVLVEDYEVHKFCDDCGTEIKIGLACMAAKCAYCGKDLCKDCIAYEDPSWGDYRGTLWCKDCWDIGEDYRLLIKHHQAEVESLYNEWQTKCKERR